MRRALDLAWAVRASTSPNPWVGAVIEPLVSPALRSGSLGVNATKGARRPPSRTAPSSKRLAGEVRCLTLGLGRRSLTEGHSLDLRRLRGRRSEGLREKRNDLSAERLGNFAAKILGHSHSGRLLRYAWNRCCTG